MKEPRVSKHRAQPFDGVDHAKVQHPRIKRFLRSKSDGYETDHVGHNQSDSGNRVVVQRGVGADWNEHTTYLN